MKKYEVRTVTVYTKDGKNTYEVFSAQVDQDTDLVAAFDTLEEARKCYAEVPTSASYIGGPVYRFRHECKLLEEDEYDEDGEFVSGGDCWELDFPEAEELPPDEDDGEA